MFRLMRRHPLVASVLLFLGLGTATIAGAWGFEIFGRYVPCKLCLEQREPYYLALPLVALAFLPAFLNGPRFLTASLLAVSAGAMAYVAGLGLNQSGADWGLWEGPAECGGGTASSESVGGLMAQLETLQLVSCTEAAWRFLGLSFAGWNAVVSTALAGIALFGAVAALRSKRRALSGKVIEPA
ncbi:MAG: disulfide bond formation protein B [Pseudomonadota bacterium]